MTPNPTTTSFHPAAPKSPALAAPVTVRDMNGQDIAPHHLERIEKLDDVIFAALGGSATDLDRSAHLYRKTSRETPSELLDESREKYLCRAESIVEDYHRAPGESLAQTFAALEILTLVAED